MSWIYVACGGAIGATLRYLLSVLLPFAGGFPWATWLANIIGCFLAGMFLAVSEKFTALNPDWRLFLVVGILGGFTTFSSFSLETIAMLRQQLYVLAASYILSSLLLGLVSVFIGYIILKTILY